VCGFIKACVCVRACACDGILAHLHLMLLILLGNNGIHFQDDFRIFIRALLYKRNK
jgi:hypothetical protein